MANEISLTSGVQVRKGSLISDVVPFVKQITMNGSGGPTPGTVSIGTSEYSTSFPELTTEGILWMRNLDDTNYIEWGFSTGVYGGKMKPGEPAEFRMKPGLTLYLKANTAPCKCQIYGYED